MVNPYKIWLMVVLISGLNFASYLLVKMVGAEHGIGLTGLLGGLVSSTAVTLGFSQRSRQRAGAEALALGILVAWTVMFVRVCCSSARSSVASAPRLAPRWRLFGVPSLAICWFLWRRQRARDGQVSAGRTRSSSARRSASACCSA